MKKVLKSVLRLLGQMAIVAAVLIGFQVVTDGMWLFGLPELDQVESVSIAYPQVTEKVKTVTGAEDKELALKLTGFLKYNLFQKADDGQQPLITITYHLQDGTDRSIAANGTTVWWKDKAYALKDPDIFVNLTEGIFFLAEVQAR